MTKATSMTNDLESERDKIFTFISRIDLPIIITSHSQADLDSLSSALLLRELIKNYNFLKETYVILPKISKLTQKAIITYDLEIFLTPFGEIKSSVENFLLILVDTNQPDITDLDIIFPDQNKLSCWNDSKAKIIIDHHLLTQRDIKSDISIIKPNYCSTTEIILDYYNLNKDINHKQEILSISLLGILFDSKRLALVNSSTLIKIAGLLETLGGTLQKYMNFFYNEREYSQRIASLKSGQRNEIVKIHNKFLISLSFVSSYESSAAQSLISLGSDISAVANISENEIRISLRSTIQFYEKSKVHCGELANKIGEIFDGTGSGHPTASGCNIKNYKRKFKSDKPKKVLFDFIIDYIEEKTTHLVKQVKTDSE